jgi:hypothetical protein
MSIKYVHGTFNFCTKLTYCMSLILYSTASVPKVQVLRYMTCRHLHHTSHFFQKTFLKLKLRSTQLDQQQSFVVHKTCSTETLQYISLLLRIKQCCAFPMSLVQLVPPHILQSILFSDWHNHCPLVDPNRLRFLYIHQMHFGTQSSSKRWKFCPRMGIPWQCHLSLVHWFATQFAIELSRMLACM